MTAKEIQRGLIRELFPHTKVMPNWTPPGWYECDLFAMTRAGYSTEYEIKISRSDFKADAAKGKEGWKWNHDAPGRSKLEKVVEPRKHERLANADTTGPSRFFFVVPFHLVEISDVPEWAGLMYAERNGRRMVFKEMKPAPKLHRAKVSDSWVNVMEAACYWRYLRMLVYSNNPDVSIPSATNESPTPVLPIANNPVVS